MKIEITKQQKNILNSLCLKNEKEFTKIIFAIENGCLSWTDVEKLCALINDEFMIQGILPSFEPNAYGIELEGLLDVINRARINS